MKMLNDGMRQTIITIIITITICFILSDIVVFQDIYVQDLRGKLMIIIMKMTMMMMTMRELR